MVEPAKKCWHEEGKGALHHIQPTTATPHANRRHFALARTSFHPSLLISHFGCVLTVRALRWAGYEIMERILKPLVGVFDDVMQELHDSRVPDVGREEEDAFMSKAVQYIRQYILSDRVTMR